MEEILRGSGLDWTVIRPPWADRQASHRQLPGGVRPEPPPRPVHLTRHVAHLMLGVLEQPETIHRATGIAN